MELISNAEKDLRFYKFYLKYRMKDIDYCKSHAEDFEDDPVINDFINRIMATIKGDFDKANKYTESLVTAIIPWDNKEINSIPKRILFILALLKDTNLGNYNNIKGTNSSATARDYYNYLAIDSRISDKNNNISSLALYELISDQNFGLSSTITKVLLLRHLKYTRDNALLFSFAAQVFSDFNGSFEFLFLAAYYGCMDSMLQVSKLCKYQYNRPAITLVFSSMILSRLWTIKNLNENELTLAQEALTLFISTSETGEDIDEKLVINVLNFLVQKGVVWGYYGYYLHYKYPYYRGDLPLNKKYFMKKSLEKFKELNLKAFNNLQLFDDLHNLANIPYNQLLELEYDNLFSSEFSDLFSEKEIINEIKSFKVNLDNIIMKLESSL